MTIFRGSVGASRDRSSHGTQRKRKVTNFQKKGLKQNDLRKVPITNIIKERAFRSLFENQHKWVSPSFGEGFWGGAAGRGGKKRRGRLVLGGSLLSTQGDFLPSRRRGGKEWETKSHIFAAGSGKRIISFEGIPKQLEKKSIIF